MPARYLEFPIQVQRIMDLEHEIVCVTAEGQWAEKAGFVMGLVIGVFLGILLGVYSG